jgi:hypothetical protein
MALQPLKGSKKYIRHDCRGNSVNGQSRASFGDAEDSRNQVAVYRMPQRSFAGSGRVSRPRFDLQLCAKLVAAWPGAEGQRKDRRK